MKYFLVACFLAMAGCSPSHEEIFIYGQMAKDQGIGCFSIKNGNARQLASANDLRPGAAHLDWTRYISPLRVLGRIDNSLYYYVPREHPIRPESTLVPGIYRKELSSPTANPTLVVRLKSIRSIVREGNSGSWWIADEDGKVETINLQTGVREPTLIEGVSFLSWDSRRRAIIAVRSKTKAVEIKKDQKGVITQSNLFALGDIKSVFATENADKFVVEKNWSVGIYDTATGKFSVLCPDTVTGVTYDQKRQVVLFFAASHDDGSRDLIALDVITKARWKIGFGMFNDIITEN